jgi:hypothetical protein
MSRVRFSFGLREAILLSVVAIALAVAFAVAKT